MLQKVHPAHLYHILFIKSETLKKSHTFKSRQARKNKATHGVSNIYSSFNNLFDVSQNNYYRFLFQYPIQDIFSSVVISSSLQTLVKLDLSQMSSDIQAITNITYHSSFSFLCIGIRLVLLLLCSYLTCCYVNIFGSLFAQILNFP